MATQFGGHVRFANLLTVAGIISPDDSALLGFGRAILDWHATHQFCHKCGGGTHATLTGDKRICTACGQSQWPQASPVVLMLVCSKVCKVNSLFLVSVCVPLGFPITIPLVE